MPRSLALLPLLLCAWGCGATTPLLAEPRAPTGGDLRLQTGAAALAPIAGDVTALPTARRTLSSPPAGPVDASVQTIHPGAAVLLAARPGIAPVVRASVLAHPAIEAGVRYGGRDVGASGRWFFYEHRTPEASSTTLSLGLDARALLLHGPEQGLLPGAAIENWRGYGGSVPFVLAWQSDAGLLLAYAGATVGFDRVTARVAYPGLGAPTTPDPTDPRPDLRLRDAGVSRLFGSFAVGVGVGLRKVHALVELGVEHDRLFATFDSTTARVSLTSLAPAFALSTSF